jgi:hypothetical protein
MNEKHYEVGALIEYSAFGGEKRRVRVDEKCADIKNGQPGFFGIGQDREHYWGYDSQITRVLDPNPYEK